MRFSVSNGEATNKNYIETGGTATLSWTALTLRTAYDQTLISLTVAGQNQAINTAVEEQAGTMQVSPTVTTLYTMTAVYQYSNGNTKTVPKFVTLYVDEPTVADIVPDTELQKCIAESHGQQFTYARQFNEYMTAQKNAHPDYFYGTTECESKGVADLTGIGYFTTLEKLLLDVNSITDILPVASLTNLKILRFGNNSVSDINPLQYLVNLESLTIAGNGGITNISVLPTLKDKKLTYVDAEGLNALDSFNCTILQNLAVCDGFTVDPPTVCTEFRDPCFPIP
jgi:hypothetical protein